MDLVVGATGLVGRRIALRLREQGRDVRALVRGGATRAQAKELVAAGIQTQDGDLIRPETLAPACAGIDTVVSTATSMPTGQDDGLRRVDLEGSLALIAAADQAGVKRFVYISYSGNLRIDCSLEAAKRGCENRLRSSHMKSVILRPSYFMEVWLSPMLGFDPAKGAARIYGTGEAKVSYISATDVADFAVAAVTRRETGNEVVEMGGPQALSQLDAVHVFEKALNKHFSLEFVPLEAIRVLHQSADPLQKTLAALTLGYAQGDVILDSLAAGDRFGVWLHSVANYAASYEH